MNVINIIFSIFSFAWITFGFPAVMIIILLFIEDIFERMCKRWSKKSNT